VSIGVVVAVTVALLHSPAVGLLLGWDTVAVLYIGWLAFVLLGRDAEQTALRATTTDPDRVATDAALLTAAVASLVTVALVLLRAPQTGRAAEFVQVGFGVVSVVVSWAMVHILYTLRYAALYYGRPGGGIDFNSAEPPTYRDFAYLAFTVGMTFQVSDTVLHSTTLRRTVLRHALLSYLFGTGILATTINLVASLRSG
jgi:uncharacterized membrane protein